MLISLDTLNYCNASLQIKVFTEMQRNCYEVIYLLNPGRIIEIIPQLYVHD